MTYGQIAREVVRRLRSNAEHDASQVWDQVQSVRRTPHSCPKGAFLGLYEQGWIKGVGLPKNRSSKGKNKLYTVVAAKLLLEHPERAESSPGQLWRFLHEHWPFDDVRLPPKPMYQMEVLLALWPDLLDYELIALAIRRDGRGDPA